MDNTCTRLRANDFISRLIGQPLRYGLKSPDMDLYDLGFGDDVEFLNSRGNRQKACTYALHIVSAIIIFWENGPKVEYDRDTPYEEFQADIRQLIGTRVQRVALSEKNDLWLDFGQCYMAIATLEDGDESWRLFLPASNESHLVVSDLWLQKD